MAKREFLMQAHKFNHKKHNISGWYISEKLDGMRCLWDGGITRGTLASSVPWANTTKDKREFTSTGLWTRKGKPIFAPDWWLDSLPSYPLDGELFVGRGERQTTMSYCRKHTPLDGEWLHVKLHVFDAPSLYQAIPDGNYYDTNCDVVISGITDYLDRHNARALERRSFAGAMSHVTNSTSAVIHDQMLLSDDIHLANDQVARAMDKVLSLGGEGLVFRNPTSIWLPERSHDVLKLKPYIDDEATVIGYVSGRETSRGSKLRGLMGALVVSYKDSIVFELSGFTDYERRLTHEMDPSYGAEYAWDNPGEELPSSISAVEFPRGSTITFKYRELSKAGVPIEASYFRKHLES